jgi:hypothetical protein
MTPQMRNFYKIERRWKDAEELDLSYLLTSNGRVVQEEEVIDDGFDSDIEEEEEEEVKSIVPDENDPFWS